jgi:hypothetical protein
MSLRKIALLRLGMTGVMQEMKVVHGSGSQTVSCYEEGELKANSVWGSTAAQCLPLTRERAEMGGGSAYGRAVCESHAL